MFPPSPSASLTDYKNICLGNLVRSGSLQNNEMMFKDTLGCEGYESEIVIVEVGARL